MKTEFDPVYEKNTLRYHSSGKGDPASPEKCALFSSELKVHCSVCRFPGFWRRQRVAVLYHCANCVQVGVESYCLPLHRLGIGVIHGVLKGCLAIVIFMNRTSCVLCFGCSPLFVKIKPKSCKYKCKKRHKYRNGHRTAICTMRLIWRIWPFWSIQS